MVTEQQKYRAQFFQISGFCLMTPLGKMILDLFYLKLFDILTIKFAAYFSFALFLGYFGIIVALHGMEILEESR